ncbi:MAG TPA: hypothetical protein VNO30_27690 [Kofleriaceae bacterium]|nr:hypothetical protein [Kofleriaceae bacterium]
MSRLEHQREQAQALDRQRSALIGRTTLAIASRAIARHRAPSRALPSSADR